MKLVIESSAASTYHNVMLSNYNSLWNSLRWIKSIVRRKFGIQFLYTPPDEQIFIIIVIFVLSRYIIF